MPPLAIKFPEVAVLGTKNDYLSTVAGPLLRKVDPERFFSIQQVLPVEIDRRSKPSGQKKLSKKPVTKSFEGRGGHYDPEKKVYRYSNLTKEQEAAFGPLLDCIVCGDFADATCSKCDNPYCSTGHHKQHHVDNVCPPKGQPPPAIPVVHDPFLKRDKLPTKAHVCITAVLTQAIVFVRSLDPAVVFDYCTAIADCELASLSNATRDGTEVKVVAGEIYLAPGAPHGTYGRVLLTEPGPKESKCVFIEHGTVCFVSNASLMPIDDLGLKYRKVFVYKVCLANITDEFGEVDTAVQYLNKLKGKCLEMKHKLEGDNMIDVQLRTANFKSVNEHINRLITIPPILTQKEHEAFIMYEDLGYKPPTLGENKRIMILNRMTIKFDGRVTWIDMDDLPYLEKLQGKLQHYGKKVSTFQRDFTPRLGELCLVRSMDRWHRAVCQETVGDRKPSLFLCDFGCMVKADLEHIRKIPGQFATEVRTHDGIVKGLLEAQTGGLEIDLKFLDRYLPENELLSVDISQIQKEEFTIDGDILETYNLLNIHLFTKFTETLPNNPAGGPGI
ncbi:protein vreteno-like [Anopheles ziemanni]|uniref:protein vreteno-like n=1 Tax=Anopheles coustani TaxID=139045 RepID=UPI0026590A4E|nr:protein vreteno-like [Anopheles coustani]XP_058176349.1 protein vreteno-like [Anopheles ziemanni]